MERASLLHCFRDPSGMLRIARARHRRHQVAPEATE